MADYKYRKGSAVATHAIPSRLSIKFEFEHKNTENNKVFYEVHCRTYDNKELKSEHHVANVLREFGTGLYVFPLGGNDHIHKSIRDAYLRSHPVNPELNTKAKWADEGFLFKEKH